jgi:hypothetical protein
MTAKFGKLNSNNVEEMGIIDFPDWVAGELTEPKGMPMDEYGNMMFSDEYMEKEGGYDMNQHAYEDQE